MKFFSVLALAGAAVAATTTTAETSHSSSFSTIAPTATDPAGCSSSYDGHFEISVVNISALSTKRSTALVCTLEDGVLIDEMGRVGYIASNYQFQFDWGGQAGELYTAGWSACSNNTLALGSSAIFYECLSGTFYNLYDESTGAQCTAIYIDIVPIDSSSSSTTSSITGTVTSTATEAVSQITDGQIQATTSTSAVVVSQISDGQIQATTATSTSAVVVSQISDGQIQATTATSAAVAAAVTTSSVSSSSSVAVVSQISDGQIQASATNGTKVTSTSQAATSLYTGAATLPSLRAEVLGAAAAGALAFFAL